MIAPILEMLSSEEAQDQLLRRREGGSTGFGV
jgi:hypothetical protein